VNFFNRLGPVGFSSILRFSHVKSFGVCWFPPSLFYAFYYFAYYLFREDLIWVLLLLGYLLFFRSSQQLWSSLLSLCHETTDVTYNNVPLNNCSTRNLTLGLCLGPPSLCKKKHASSMKNIIIYNRKNHPFNREIR